MWVLAAWRKRLWGSELSLKRSSRQHVIELAVYSIIIELQLILERDRCSSHHTFKPVNLENQVVSIFTNIGVFDGTAAPIGTGPGLVGEHRVRLITLCNFRHQLFRYRVIQQIRSIGRDKRRILKFIRTRADQAMPVDMRRKHHAKRVCSLRNQQPFIPGHFGAAFFQLGLFSPSCM